MRGGVVLLPVAVGLCLLAGLAAGTVPLSPAEVWHGLWRADSSASVIVRDLRAPRVLLAFLVGGSLGVCGAALQAMIRNPLAEPYLLGLSGGAGLGAVHRHRHSGDRALGGPGGRVRSARRRRGAGLPAEPRGGPAARSARAAALGRRGGLVRRRAHECHHGAVALPPVSATPSSGCSAGSVRRSWQSLGVFVAYAIAAARRPRPECQKPRSAGPGRGAGPASRRGRRPDSRHRLRMHGATHGGERRHLRHHRVRGAGGAARRSHRLASVAPFAPPARLRGRRLRSWCWPTSSPAP